MSDHSFSTGFSVDRTAKGTEVRFAHHGPVPEYDERARRAS
jgi:hypothetical protein